jgi:hypothetical protein
VIIEGTDLPAEIGWNANYSGDGSAESTRLAKDKKLVLTHLQEQTGLTWTEETRKVRRLFVEKAPAGAKGLPEAYWLAEGEMIKRIEPPMPAEREAFFLAETHGREDHVPEAMVVEWRNGEAMLWGTNGWYRLKGLIGMRRNMGVRPWEVVGDEALLNLQLPGDFAFRYDPDVEAYRASVEKIAGRVLGRRVTLDFREVERPVYVFKGAWHYTPVKEREGETGAPVVELYAGDFVFNREGGGVGTMEETAEAVADYVEQPVVMECTGGPKELWVHSIVRSDKEERLRVENPELVIRHVEEQTGLKAVVERRKVRRLFVDREW